MSLAAGDARRSFDRRDDATILRLPDAGRWQAFEPARIAMVFNFAQSHVADRRRASA